jgi:hypothetical protein
MIKAYTDNKVRKIEYEKDSLMGVEILKKVPRELLQGNEDKISLVTDDGVVIAIYFSRDAFFDDVTYRFEYVELVSLKLIKETGVHYYKYYVRFNPLNIKIDNIVSTGFTSNDDTKATVYTTQTIHPVEEENALFFLKDFEGHTIDLKSLEVIKDTLYETHPPSP